MKRPAPVHRAQRAADPASARAAGSPQHSIAQSAFLHLAPGLATLLVYIVIGIPVADALGYPSAFGFLLSTALVLIPVELGLLLYLGAQRNGRLSLDGIVLYRERLPAGRLARWVAVLFVWSVAAAVLASPLDAALRESLFGWVPDRFLLDIDADEYSRTLVVLLYVAIIVGSGIAAPLVAELYFRGFLLPRLSRVGIWAPVLEMVLFALYHLWTPWQAVSRILFYLPTVYAVWRKRSIAIAVWVHCLGNTLGALLALVGVLVGA